MTYNPSPAISLLLPILSALIPLCFGLLLAGCLLGISRRWTGFLLILSLAPGIGLAITSVIYFFWMYIYQPRYALERYVILEVSLFIVTILACVTYRIIKRKDIPISGGKTSRTQHRFDFPAVLSIAAAILFSLSFIAFLNEWQLLTYDHPRGDWDAWAIWNLHARFIYSGARWMEGFSTAIRWSHPDYPLLLPVSIARVWVMLGSRTQAVPIMINLIFTISILSVIVAGMGYLRGWKTAVFAGLLTLPILGESLGFLQYADMPLAFFFLSANLLLFMADAHTAGLPRQGSGHERRFWMAKLLHTDRYEHKLPAEKQSAYNLKAGYSSYILSGLAVGAALWTKNEGWALLIALGVSEITSVLIYSDYNISVLKRWAFLLAGSAPFLVAVIMFKNLVNIPDNLMAGILKQNILVPLLDPSRYITIGKVFLQQFVSYGELRVPLMLLLIIYLLVAGFNLLVHERTALFKLVVRVGVIAVIYFGVYVLTTSSLEWHLETSLTRLISQLLPSIILIVFLSTNQFESQNIRHPT